MLQKFTQLLSDLAANVYGHLLSVRSSWGGTWELNLGVAVNATTKLGGLMPSVVRRVSALGVMRADAPFSLCFCLRQQLYQIQQVTMPAGQDITQPMFIQSTNQTSDGQATQVTGD